MRTVMGYARTDRRVIAAFGKAPKSRGHIAEIRRFDHRRFYLWQKAPA